MFPVTISDKLLECAVFWCDIFTFEAVTQEAQFQHKKENDKNYTQLPIKDCYKTRSIIIGLFKLDFVQNT